MLEICVPISPKPYFFRQVECLYRSAQACGGLTGNVRMVVSVGEDIEPYEIAATQPWSDTNVIWRWAPREEFRELSYLLRCWTDSEFNPTPMWFSSYPS